MPEAAPPEPLRHPSGGTTTRTWIAVTVQAVTLLVLGVLWMPDEIRVDDAWISFRYAENFAAGNGLVFNPGELHLGTTSPLYAMTVGSLRAVTGMELIHIVVALHLAAILLVGFVVPQLLRRRPGDRPVWLGGIVFAWIFLTAPWVSETMGMETIPFVAIGLWMILCCVNGRDVLFGALLPVLCMIRPDGAILGGILLGAQWSWTRRLPLRPMIVAAIVGLPWLVFSFVTYGSPLPRTIAAKLAQARSDLWREHFLDQLWPLITRDGYVFWVGLAAVGALLALWRRERVAVLVLGWLLLHNGVFALVGVPPCPWYYVVFMALTAYLAAHALTRLLDLASRRWQAGRWQPRLQVEGRTAAFVLTAVAALLHAGIANRGSPVLKKPLYPRSDRYFTIGQWLAENTPAGASIAMTEVGIIGYVSKRRIVDLIGLVSPGVSPHVVDQTHVAFAMETYRPDYFLMHPPAGRQEDGLQHLIDHGFVCVFALADCSIYLRLDADEAELARRVVTAIGERRGTCLVADFPRWLDFERFRAAVATQQPRVPIVQTVPTPAPDIAWVARLQGDGSFRTEPFAGVDAAMFSAAEVRQWATFDLTAAPPHDGRGRWVTQHAFSHLTADVHLAGPLRRVRIGLRIEELPGGGSGTGTLAWTSTFSPDLDPRNTVSFPVHVTDGIEDIVVELPAKRFRDEERLERLFVAPLDRPGTFTVEAIHVERY